MFSWFFSPVVNDQHCHLKTKIGKVRIANLQQSNHVASHLMTALLNDSNSGPNCWSQTEDYLCESGVWGGQKCMWFCLAWLCSHLLWEYVFYFVHTILQCDLDFGFRTSREGSWTLQGSNSDSEDTFYNAQEYERNTWCWLTKEVSSILRIGLL